MMGKELPKQWVSIPFTEVFDISGGTQPPKSEFLNEPTEGFIRLLQIRDFGEKPVPTYIPNKKKLKKCNSDDILIARYGASIGRIVTGMEGAYNVALAKVIIPGAINKIFVRRLLESNIFQEPILSIQRTAQNGFNKNDLAEILIPLPPLPEQQRIVAKLDQLFGQLELIKASLNNIPQLLKDFRQQVLTQAVTGKLTNCSVKTKKLGSLLTDVKYGTSKKSLPEIDGTPIFRIPNINDGEIDDTDLKYSVLDDKEYEKLKLEENDILIIRSNGSVSLVGKTAIIREKHIGYSYAGYLIRLRCGSNLNAEFLNYSLQSNSLRRQIVDTSRSTSGVNNINSTEIKELIIQLPVLEEQERIVLRIKQLLSKADRVQIHYEALKEKIDLLPQTILHKAFKGELVRQLASDGDAKDLLEEIKALKAGLDKKPVGTKKKKTKTYKVGDALLRKVAEKHEGYKN